MKLCLLTYNLGKDFELDEVIPRGAVETGQNHTRLSWNLTDQTKIYVTYRFVESDIQSEPGTTIHIDSQTMMLSAGIGVSILIALIVAAIAAYVNLKRRQKRLLMGKMMGVLSGNEYMVVDILLKKGGGLKRAEVERASGLSKSSLAAVVNNLERKKVISVDRTYTSHYLEVRESFLKP